MTVAHVVLALHAHLPWVRSEHDDAVEGRWMSEAAWDCHLPLAALLRRLEADDVHAPLTLTLSPPLASMWRDPVLYARATTHRGRVRAFVEERLARRDGTAPALRAHLDRLDEAEAEAARGDLVDSLARLHRASKIELVATAASHGFLPGLGPVARRAQVALGLSYFERVVGVPATGLWLPECAFEPSLEPLLAELGGSITFVDSHAFELAAPRPPLGARATLLSPSGVMFFARDHLSVDAVWSRTTGYPANPVYREFFVDLARDATDEELARHGLSGPYGARLPTGVKVHAVGRGPEKPTYEPERAALQAERDADDLVERLERALTREPAARAVLGPELLVLAFDAELFGHFWWEGPIFLERLLRRLADHERLRVVRPTERAEEFPDAFVAMPAASTWGRGGFARTWTGEKTGALWREVHRAERLVTGAIPRLPPEELTLLARNWLLLQASDWPFLLHQDEGGTFPRAELERRSRAVERLARGSSKESAASGSGDDTFLAPLGPADFLGALGFARGAA